MSTAASADCGRSARSEFRKMSSTATMPAPTNDESCDLAPACSTTAVRDPLVDTAKPWRNPAATFAAPMPIISWFGSTSSPRRAPKLDEVAIVSARETSVIPTAATSSGPASASFVHGSDGVGTPLGRVPTVRTPCAWRSARAETTVAATIADEYRRHTTGEPGQDQQDDEHPDADEQ